MASSPLFLQMNFQEAGTDPFFSDGIVDFFPVKHDVKLRTDVSC